MGLGFIQVGGFGWASRFRLILPPLGKIMITCAIPQKQGQGVITNAMPQQHTKQGHRLL